MAPQTKAIITADPLDLTAYLTWVTEAPYGAVASFCGTVRSPNQGETVRYIDYEGYEAMMNAQIQVIATQLRSELELGHILIAHRLGRLYPGEVSVALVMSAVHRREALLGCQRGIDLVKDLLPVWKYEVTTASSHWVAGSSKACSPLS
jgi:molybdopterin synthase catalytic subunit